MLKELMKEFDEAKNDAGFDKGHPIFEMAQHIDQLSSKVRRLERLNHNLVCDLEDDEDYFFCDCDKAESTPSLPCRSCGGLVEGGFLISLKGSE